MRTRRRTGSYEAGRVRREAIIDAATLNFASEGYHRTPLAQIAADVGITDGGLLHHFPSKRHLLLAVAERRLEVTEQWWNSENDPSDPLAPFRRMIGTIERFAREPGLIELFVLVSSQAAAETGDSRRAYAEWYRRAVAGTRVQFQACCDAGYLRRDADYELVAREAIAVADGLQLQWVLAEGDLDIVHAIVVHARRLAVDLLLPEHQALVERLASTE